MTPSGPRDALNRALARVLRPLVRLALAQGITYPALAEMLKLVFVDVARREFALGKQPPSDSRINLLTGIHRKEIRRLRGLPPAGAEDVPEAVSLGVQLVGAWLSRPPFVDDEGRPRPLSRLASVGGDASFEALVAGVSRDIRSRVVLDEWLRLGVAAINERDEVVLNTDAFVPADGAEEKTFYFGHNLHDHAAAAVHNLLGEGPPWLERGVHYDALAPRSVAELEELARNDGMKMLQALNGRARELEARDAREGDHGEARRRFTCGIYFFAEETPQGDRQP